MEKVKTGFCLILLSMVWIHPAYADGGSGSTDGSGAKKPKIIYPKETKLDFEGAKIEGEIQNPGEFYFQHKSDEKFDSLIKRRKNFHREMMRDVVFSK